MIPYPPPKGTEAVAALSEAHTEIIVGLLKPFQVAVACRHGAWSVSPNTSSEDDRVGAVGAQDVACADSKEAKRIGSAQALEEAPVAA